MKSYLIRYAASSDREQDLFSWNVTVAILQSRMLEVQVYANTPFSIYAANPVFLKIIRFATYAQQLCAAHLLSHPKQIRFLVQ